MNRKEFCEALRQALGLIFMQSYVKHSGSLECKSGQRQFSYVYNDGYVTIGVSCIGNTVECWHSGVMSLTPTRMIYYYYDSEDDHNSVVTDLCKGLEGCLAQLSERKPGQVFFKLKWTFGPYDGKQYESDPEPEITDDLDGHMLGTPEEDHFTEDDLDGEVEPDPDDVDGFVYESIEAEEATEPYIPDFTYEPPEEPVKESEEPKPVKAASASKKPVSLEDLDLEHLPENLDDLF